MVLTSHIEPPCTLLHSRRLQIQYDDKMNKMKDEALGKLKLVTSDGENRLRRSEDGLFRGTQGEPLPTNAQARVQSGALEGSNVNPIEAMVGMIAAARQFEVQMRMLQNGEGNDRAASQLLGMNG